MADQFVKFVSKTELNVKKEEKRRAREQLIEEAKAEYEREELRREKRKATGEDTWMLPSVSDRIADDDDDDEHRKKKKRKKKNKEKKSKKNKKKSKKEKDASSGSDSDEWVEKDAGNPEDKDEPVGKEMPIERDGWMLFPCFSGSAKPSAQEREQDKADEVEMEENKKLSAIDSVGQHHRELNPYWKDGGIGLPTEQGKPEKPADVTTMYDAKWLKKALQRSKDQAEEEGLSIDEVVSQRWGSLEKLETLIAEAEKRDAEKRYTEETGDQDRNFERDKGRSWNRNNNRERYYRRDERDRGRDRTRDRDDESPRKSRHHDDERRDKNYSNRDKNKSYHREDKKDFESKDANSSSRGQRSDKDTLSESKRSEEQFNSGSRHRGENVERGPDRASAQNAFKRPDNSNTLSSSKFMKPSDDSTNTSTTPSSKLSQSSGAWRKKSAQTEPKVNRIEQALKKKKEKSQENDQENSSSESSVSDVEDTTSRENKAEVEEESKSSEKSETEPQPVVPVKKVTEADLNSMGAKILRAELMGNEDLAAELKTTLEQMRKDKVAQEASTSTREEPRQEEVVVLTRTDKFGNTRPVNLTENQEPKRGRRKREKVTTHDDSGQRERYFADDDRYDINEIVRREKMNTAEDYDSMFSRLASKGATKTDNDDFNLDDHFVSTASNKYSKAKEEERERMRAIKEHQRLSAQLSRCRFCFENPDLAKHLIIAIGMKVYLALPLHTSLTEGHCLIIPMQHQFAFTYLDEDVVDEIKVFKKGLTRMFQEMDKDVVFLETCRNLTKQNHMIIECIPVPKEEGDLAPMYFKKAILESDSEWAHNKKLIDTSKKGLRGSIPKGLPYFSVEFGLDGGFAHVVEEEQLFQQYFGKEIIGGMLDLEPWTWHKPHKENFEQHKKKVLQFADWWKPYDWTKKLRNNK